MENKKACNFKVMPEFRHNSAVDIEFTDLSYAVKDGSEKRILRSVSGKFYSGELTAILGASGAGKTTLLNILSGYVSKGVTGSIRINGAPRDMRTFHKISTYIMQEDLLQPYLSVEELIMTATRLKLADHVSLQKRRKIVMKVSDILGLGDCLETWTQRLSGGQRKRLSVALEMVNNPPVIFLDEPTSGLDTVSIKQCVEALKSLTGQGRTVVCTIHQPSDATFQNFHQVYFIQDGMCVYNGSTSNLVPFMSSLGYECPINYSPADYIIETLQTIPESKPVLVDSIENGKISFKESRTENAKGNYKLNKILYNTSVRGEETNLDMNFPTSSWSQFCILFSRMMLQLKRNKLLIVMQLFTASLCSSLIGILYYNIGHNASFAVDNFKYCLVVPIFFIYVHLMSTVLLFPVEVELLKREYFNRWYGLKSYYLAMTLKNLPLMLICCTILILPTYLLSDQPLTWDRLFRFAVASLLTAATSEGLGLAIGSVCCIKIGAVLASVLTGVLILLCIYGVGQTTYISLPIRMMRYISYLRCSLVALVLSIGDGNRHPFVCTDEIYCYYTDIKKALRDAGMLNASYGFHILGLIIYLVSFRVIAFVLLRYRLTSEFSNTFIRYYIRKFF